VTVIHDRENEAANPIGGSLALSEWPIGSPCDFIGSPNFWRR
jgi:hypothetical protein